MDKDEVLERVVVVVCDVLGVDAAEVEPEARFVEDLGAESIQSVELVAGFEEEFDIEMDEDTALQVTTVSSAVDFIAVVVAEQHSE